MRASLLRLLAPFVLALELHVLRLLGYLPWRVEREVFRIEIRGGRVTVVGLNAPSEQEMERLFHGATVDRATIRVVYRDSVSLLQVDGNRGEPLLVVEGSIPAWHRAELFRMFCWRWRRHPQVRDVSPEARPPDPRAELDARAHRPKPHRPIPRRGSLRGRRRGGGGA